MNAESSDHRAAGMAFGQLADEFCGLVDSLPALGGESFLRRIQDCLPRLYVAGLRLPRVAAEGPVASEMPDADYRRAYEHIAAAIGADDLYWEVYDPTVREQDEVVAGSLADDLGDIYRDLKRGQSLAPANGGSTWANALWEWQFGWESHWGTHAANAIRALHWILDPTHQRDSLDWPDANGADA